MGNVSSRFEDASTLLHLSQQSRLTVTKVKITNAQNRHLYSIYPNTYPATRYTVHKETDDDTNTEYVQNPDVSAAGTPSFLLKLYNDEDLRFYFTFQMRQDLSSSIPVDTVIKNLTFIFSSSPKDLDTLITREFNADPNLHKNPNVDLVGDYSTNGAPVEEFEWMWTWRPPKSVEDRGGGFRTCCSFSEYDQRAHSLRSLVTFSFWVQSIPSRVLSKHPSPRIELTIPSRTSRVPSSQSIESRLSDSEPEAKDFKEPPSPITTIPEYGLGIEPEMIPETVQVDINMRQAEADISTVDDGPVFRSAMKDLEGKTANMKSRMKNVLKKAQAAKEAQSISNTSYHNFLEALRDASASNANAVKPALDHYFEKIATEILTYEQQNAINLQRLIIDPMTRLYANDIKQAESKKKAFDEGTREYYSYVKKYLGQGQESFKDKKLAEKDTKYQNRRRDFELKRFDYSRFLQDLHGGRKDQEVLSHLTKFAEAQSRAYLATGKKVEAMIPQLDVLCAEVREADKQYQLLRTKSEERRRALETGEKRIADAEANLQYMPTVPNSVPEVSSMPQDIISNGNSLKPSNSLSDRSRVPSGSTYNGSIAGSVPSDSGMSPMMRAADDLYSTRSKSQVGPQFDSLDATPQSAGVQIRKEGILWSMKSGAHAEGKGLNKWHKYWIVLDQGRLSESRNWQGDSQPQSESTTIDLRVASVREARNSERRFCFEIITPQSIRTYQATGEDDMRSWMQAINNALQSAFETRKASLDQSSPVDNKGSTSLARDLFGKSSSFHNHRSSHSTSVNSRTGVNRHSTVGDKPSFPRAMSNDERPTQLLTSIRAASPDNAFCADCGSDSRVEWVSINLGIIVCIECSGMHRSLGTHISKIRSLTLDTNAFTQDVVELIQSVGNRMSNLVYEAALDRSTRPTAGSSRDQRQRFIQQKYVDKLFVQPLSIGSAGFHSPDETLLASIKRNDIQHVLYALALSANPNAHDRMRSVHAVFLALAAADPASPSASLDSSRSSSTNNISGTIGTSAEAKRKSFPVAEMLLQNGGDVPPASESPIPLSRSAQAYLEFKTAQRFGRTSASLHQATPPREISLSSFGSTDMSPHQRKERDGKLIKRNSGVNAFPRFNVKS